MSARALTPRAQALDKRLSTRPLTALRPSPDKRPSAPARTAQHSRSLAPDLLRRLDDQTQLRALRLNGDIVAVNGA